MTVAYVTIQKSDQGYNLKVVATYQPSLLDGIYGFWGTKKEARADAAARGFRHWLKFAPAFRITRIMRISSHVNSASSTVTRHQCVSPDRKMA